MRTGKDGTELRSGGSGRIGGGQAGLRPDSDGRIFLCAQGLRREPEGAKDDESEHVDALQSVHGDSR